MINYMANKAKSVAKNLKGKVRGLKMATRTPMKLKSRPTRRAK